MSVVQSSSRQAGIAVAQVERQRIEIKETGVHVQVRDTVHAYTNHYIKQSRPYFKNTKLRTYIDCPHFLWLARIFFVASLFGPLGSIDGIPKEISLCFSIACAIFLLIYCQHQWVSQRSLSFVRRQLVLEDQPRFNSLYEVTLTELKGVALENYQAGIGFVEMTQGRIQLQAFNKTAIKHMASAECHSRVMLFLFCLTSAYNFYFTVVAYSKS